MGCSPARPLDNPIISSPAGTQLKDTNTTKVDHRVLSEKFVPVKPSNPEIQLETIEALDILAFDPRHGLKKEFEVIGIPNYSSENVTLNGKWIYMESFNSIEKECSFIKEAQHAIEKAFIKGETRCDFQLYDNFAEIVFRDMLVLGNRNSDNGKKEHFAFPVRRQPLRREIYGWRADDGVIRPIVREIEDMLNFTTGVYTYNFDNATYTIDLKKNVIIDNQTAFARPLLGH